jgi:hypothetical protein
LDRSSEEKKQGEVEFDLMSSKGRSHNPIEDKIMPQLMCTGKLGLKSPTPHQHHTPIRAEFTPILRNKGEF